MNFLPVPIQEFLETGGNVLVAIMAVTFVLWALMLERSVYWAVAHKSVVDDKTRVWRDSLRALRSIGDPAKRKWAIGAERDRLVSEVRSAAEQNVELIKTLVAILPLLGLLGTVTGMVFVFDVMAISGSSNARAMSAGVSKATIPTMAGMVAALSGLFFSQYLDRGAKKATQRFADSLDPTETV